MGGNTAQSERSAATGAASLHSRRPLQQHRGAPPRNRILQNARHHACVTCGTTAAEARHALFFRRRRRLLAELLRRCPCSSASIFVKINYCRNSVLEFKKGGSSLRVFFVLPFSLF
jgi:hypothetical protein